MSFLTQLHADLRRARLTRRGATQRPEDVPRGVHKEYPRMERIALPEPEPLVISLVDALDKRSSSVNESGSDPISLQEIATLLGHALRKRADRVNRNYPSGGALYPVETYLIAASFAGARLGVYHYHPSAHALERLWDLPDNFEMRSLVSKPDFLSPSMLIVFTSMWERSSAKYGDLSYLHALLEAGHMSENVLLLSSALNLEVRPMAGFNDERTSEILDLDEKQEQPVHAITLSKGGRSKQSSENISE